MENGCRWRAVCPGAWRRSATVCAWTALTRITRSLRELFVIEWGAEGSGSIPTILLARRLCYRTIPLVHAGAARPVAHRGAGRAPMLLIAIDADHTLIFPPYPWTI